ncbi:exosortase A [Zooshikella sp. RANM57]|uniref:exosortase A n=1 Tax=Zooshikella sp. RANM57 TaxID=3425863 RepID=UPI003D6E5051
MTSRIANNTMSLPYLLIPLLVIWLLAFFPTHQAMVHVWINSVTFAHGFLIVPMALYLFWQRRQFVSLKDAQPSWLASLILLGLAIVWFVANAAGVNVVQQLAVVLMIPMIIWGLLGFQVLKQVAFPVGYLLFAVPMGENLVPLLQEITAWFSVKGLQLVGIPVYWEGYYISIPSGDFLVAEACSGIRYLIASAALGAFYAYITFNSLKKRILFIGISLVLPIVANGIRAWGIIMIAYYSNMKYAVGVDHILYGWVFFGIVMLLLFWIGGKFADNPITLQSTTNTTEADQTLPKGDSRFSVSQDVVQPIEKQHWRMLVWLTVIIICIPILTLLNQPSAVSQVAFTLPEKVANWQLTKKQPINWKPTFSTPHTTHVTYQNDVTDQSLFLFSAHYTGGERDIELVSYANQLFDDDNWKILSQQVRSIEIAEKTYSFYEYVVEHDGQRRLLWSWYVLNNKVMTNIYLIKLYQAYGKLTGQFYGGSFLAMATDFDIKPSEAREKLQRFLTEAMPLLTESLVSYKP